jgi:predicted permease
MRAFINRILGLFRNKSLESRIDEELQFHLEMKTEENLKRGMDPQAARNQALHTIGGIDQVKEEHRDVRAFRLVTDFLQDLRFGFRMLRRKPAFAFIAIITLALAIGPNTAFFSIIKGIQHRYLPFPDPDRFVQFVPANLTQGFRPVASYADFEDYVRFNRTLESAALFYFSIANVSGPEEAERLSVLHTTASLFPMLKRAPKIGRLFTTDDCKPGAQPVVVLSHSLWERLYSKNPSMLGRSLSIDHISYAIIGVMPEDFAFPETKYKLWIPIKPDDMALSPRDNRFGWIVARLRPGVSLASAQQDISGITARLSLEYPATKDAYGVLVEDYYESHLGKEQKLIIGIVYLAVTLVLLIACVTISTLLMAKATSRNQEIAVRTSIGGARSRLLRQLLTENMVIAAFGGILGILASFAWLKGILAIVPLYMMPNNDRIGIDGLSFLYTAGIALLSSFLFGILPALQSTGRKVMDALKEGSRTSFGRSRHRLLNSFIVLETSMAVILLIATGMLVQSYRNEISGNPGFDKRNLLTLQLELDARRPPHSQDAVFFIDNVISEFKDRLGTRLVAVTQNLPMRGVNYSDTFSVQTHSSFINNEKPWASGLSVTPDYFRTLNIPLLQGRSFSESDGRSRPAAIISENIAKQYFSDTSSPIGMMIRFDNAADKRWMEIVGVAGDVRAVWNRKITLPQIYMPYALRPTAATLVVKTPKDPLQYAEAAKKLMRTINPEQPVTIQTMEEILDANTSNTKLLSQVISSVTLFALLFAALGIYSIISYSVSERTYEIGIRLAFGARKLAICRMILIRGLAFLGIGLCIGTAGGFACTQFLRSFLVGVTPGDSISYLITGVVLLTTGILSMLIPMLRAMSVDPMTAIRYE